MQDNRLNKIYDLYIESLISRLEQDEPLTAAEMSAIGRFLKDNNISALPTPGSSLENLIDSLPFDVEHEDFADLHSR